MLQVTKTNIEDLLVVELDVHGDERGFFVERFSKDKFTALGLPADFYQDNHSRSAPGIIRGLHYQNDPPQGKLVGVVRGKILDVAVDIRPNSKSFGQHFSIELSDTGGKLLWIPAGFAHGFCSLGDEPADVMYKTSSSYNPSGEGGIMYNDSDIAINWPIDNPTISNRDQNLMSFAEYRNNPPDWAV